MHPRAARDKGKQIGAERIAPASAPAGKRAFPEQPARGSSVHLRKAIKAESAATGGFAKRAATAFSPKLTPNDTNPLDLTQEKTVTVKEAAFRLGKSVDAIYHWLRNGRLRGLQPGGPRCAILVLKSSVEHALQFSLGRP